jgi:hypothetical protein
MALTLRRLSSFASLPQVPCAVDISTLYCTFVNSEIVLRGYTMVTTIIWLLPMEFVKRLIELRKQRGLTQQGLADAIDLHVNQIKRYEAGYSTAYPGDTGEIGERTPSNTG